MSLARFSSLLLAALLVSAVVADEAKPTISPELKKLIEKLDADDFTDRASASEQLAKLGKEALPGLLEGVHSSSPELSTRSFELLQQLFEKGDDAGKAAAKSSLEKLAQGSDRVATQAKKLLEPKMPEVDPNQPVPGAIRLLGGIGGARIRIAAPIRIAPAIAEVPVRAGKVFSISTSLVDGVKTINVDDNGKKTKIVDDPKKGIEMELTEAKDGKDVTVKFAAKNAEELKKDNPKAHEIYEKYTKGDAAAEVKIEAIAIGGGFAPVAPPAPRPAIARLPKERFEELLKKIEEQIASTTKELEASKAEKDGREEILAKRVESYNRIRDLYKKQVKELEDAAPEAPKPVEAKELKVEIEVKGEK
jgi:hypothetical protein